MNIYEEIFEQMKEYSELFDMLITFEQEKFEAVKENHLEKIDEYLKNEQVYLLKVRGLDSKRDELLKKAGYAGKTFRELINEADGDIRGELENLYEEVSQKMQRFKKLMESINSYIDMKIFSVEDAMEKIKGFEGKSEGSIYEKDAKNQPKTPQARFKSTKV